MADPTDDLREDRTEPNSPETTEGGFTLIELMVVLLIIAILLAIAIPSFLGLTSSANDRAAQSNLTNAVTEAASQYQNNAQSFLAIQTLLLANAPEFAWTAGDCFGGIATCISYQVVDAASVGDSQGLVVAIYSKATQTCWFGVQLNANPAISGASGPTQFTAMSGASTGGTFYSRHNLATTCVASTAVTSGATWKWSALISKAPAN